jgi:beta-N-acetylglucosaminidase
MKFFCNANNTLMVGHTKTSSHNKSKYKIVSLSLIKHHAIETYGGVEEELSVSIG